MSTVRFAAVIAVAIALGGITACGDDDDGSPRDVAESFADAVGEHDGEELCELLADRDKALRQAHVADCDALGRRLEGLRTRIEGVDDEEIAVDVDGGDEATIEYGDRDSGPEVDQVKRDGKWKIVLPEYLIDVP